MLVALRGVVEEAGGLGVDLDRRPAGAVDAVDDVVRAVAAELLLDAQRLGLRAGGQRERLGAVVQVEQHLARAAHRGEAADPEVLAALEGRRRHLRSWTCSRSGTKRC